MDVFFTKDEMRNTILGKTSWRICIPCQSTGFENWGEDGDDVKSGRASSKDRVDGECENCFGIGFVQSYT